MTSNAQRRTAPPVPGSPRPLPPEIRTAIKSGHVPKLRHWRGLPHEELSLGERVCWWIERFVVTPEGARVGEPMRLDLFEEAFVLSLFDGKVRPRRAILSIARKNGKTGLIAALLLAFLFMRGLVVRNAKLNSGALSRDQAALVFDYMAKAINLSPALRAVTRIQTSQKVISIPGNGCEFRPLAAAATTAMGLSPLVLVGDEWGQVRGPEHPFIDALLSSQGAHADPLAIVISTQAATDADWLSIQIDDAIRSPSDQVVCHLYTAPANCDLLDENAWDAANPASFRSRADLREQAKRASRMPTAESSFRNLCLNQRVSLVAAFMAPTPWRECSGKIDLDVFRRCPVALGLDLSSRNDLTAAVAAARDEEGVVHLLPFVYCPTLGIKERALRDRAPYDVWVKQGLMVPLGGRVMDYEQIAGHLRTTLEGLGIEVAWLIYDRWGISHFRKAADSERFAQSAEWIECGQGWRDMSPRCKGFEVLVESGRLRHGGHPLLNMAFAAAVAARDPADNVKLVKNKSTQRIDPAVAAVMAAFQVSEGATPSFDVAAMIG